VSGKPYYQDEAVTIYHADCRDVLPTLEPVDLVLTDAPYGVGVKYASFTDTPEELRKLIGSTFESLRSIAPVLAVFTGIRNMWDWPRPDWMLSWFAPGGSGLGPWGFVCLHPCLVYGKDPYRPGVAGEGSRPDGFDWTPSGYGLDGLPTANGHPVPKPLRTMRWFTTRLSKNESDTILDPFMGSGTTLRAAKDLGRKAIGIEIEERYCEIAAKRMSQLAMELNA
jgi:DNA modification methylase